MHDRISDAGDFFDDACYFFLTPVGSSLIAWICTGGDYKDIYWLPALVRPEEGLPCPKGFHVKVWRHAGTWGLFAFRPGPVTASSNEPFMSKAVEALAASDHVSLPSSHSSDAEEFDSPVEHIPGPLHSVTEVDALATPGLANSGPDSDPALPDGVSDDNSIQQADDQTSRAAEEADSSSMSLLQTASVRITRFKKGQPTCNSCSEPSDIDACNAISVWCPGRPPCSLQLTGTETFAAVRESLAASFPESFLEGLVPAFPLLPGPLQCVLPNCAYDTVALVHNIAPHCITAVTIHFCDTAALVLQRAGCSAGTLTFADRTWHDTNDGLYNGMRLYIKSPPITRALPTPCRAHRPQLQVDAVGETTPRLAHSAQDEVRAHGPAETCAPASPPVLRLAHLVAESPTTPLLQAPERSAFLGVTLDGLLQCLDPLQPAHLTSALPTGLAWHSATSSALACLSPRPVPSSLKHFTFYTDGSFCEDSQAAGWAVTVIGHTDMGDCWVGYSSGPTGADDPMNSLGNSEPSAFAAEMDAMAIALAMAASCDGCCITIAFDCQSAAGIAMTRFTSRSMPAHAKNFAVLRFIALQRRNTVDFRHVTAHSGDPFNECSDTLAKAAAHGIGLQHPCRADFFRAFNNGDMHHMWWPVSDQASDGRLPCLDDNGFLTPCPAPNRFKGPLCHLPGVPDCLRPTSDIPDGPTAWNLRLATFNVTALCNVADEECLDASFHKAGLHVIGIQDTRRFPGIRTKTKHYTRFASEGEGRNLGCQIWIHNALAPVKSQCGPEPFCSRSAVLVHASPRILAVVLRAGGTSFCFVAGHAPTSAVTDDVREEWWSQLDSVLGRVSRTALPVLLLDANARVQCFSADTTFQSANLLNHNAKCMAALLTERELDTTPLFTSRNERPVTWVSPQRNEAQLDYIVLPAKLATCSATLGVPPGFVDHNGIDHRILVATVSWQAAAHSGPRRPCFDVQAMRTEDGREILKGIFSRSPSVPWAEHPDSHLQILNDYLFAELTQHFPLPLARPRQSHISTEQWTVVRSRRQARRVLYRVKQLRSRNLLAGFFGAWRQSHCQGHAGDKAWAFLRKAVRCCFSEARITLAVRSLTHTFKQLAQRDAAVHTRQAIAEAREQGPATLAHLLRGVLKTGRRYKAPRVQAVLEDQGRSLTEPAEIQAALEHHFAAPEHGTSTSVQSLLTCEELALRPSSVAIADLPSLPDLTVGFQALQSGRAPGVTGIPAEVFSQAPLESAAAVYPIFLKGAIRGQIPIIWRGTQAVALQKPGKPAKDLTSWRNIALYDVCAKGIGKAIRSLLCPALASLSTRGQHGALKGQDIGAPSQYVQSYVRSAKAQGTSGAVVFLDGKAAYYSIMRQLLFPVDQSAANEALRSLLATLHHNPEQQDAVISAIAGPGLLAQGGVPDSLTDYLRHSLHKSWFSLDPSSGTLQVTSTGSVPGTPTADVLFQFIQTAFLKGLARRLEAEGLNAKHTGCDEPGPQPAWADDVAILTPFGHATSVIPAIRRIVHIAEEESRAGGVLLNFSAGKTEALVIFRGAGSRAVRRSHLTTDQPKTTVELATGMLVDVRLVDCYLHLGHLVSFSGSCLEDIRQRAAAANHVYRRLRATLLRNRALTVDERKLLVKSLVHSKLSYGAGLWVPQNKAEHEAVQHAFMVHWRRSCRLLCGFGSKFLTDDEVCAALEVASPRAVITAARLRQLHVVLRHGQGFLWSTIECEKSWLEQVIIDLSEVITQLEIQSSPPEIGSGVAQLLPWLHKLPSWAKRYVAASAAANSVLKEAAQTKARALFRFEQLGGVQLKIPSLAGEAWNCNICGRNCSTKSALAVHKSISHGQKALTAYAGGAACAVCGTFWWSTARLRQHIWRSPECSAIYGHADLDVPLDFEVVGTRKDLAWRPPVPVYGPHTWWSTLRPTTAVPATTPVRPAVATVSDLLCSRDGNSLEGWLKSVLTWVCNNHVQDLAQSCRPLEHRWEGLLRIICRLKEMAFMSEGIEAFGCLASGDGRTIWVVLLDASSESDVGKQGIGTI